MPQETPPVSQNLQQQDKKRFSLKKMKTISGEDPS